MNLIYSEFHSKDLVLLMWHILFFYHGTQFRKMMQTQLSWGCSIFYAKRCGDADGYAMMPSIADQLYCG